jgi:hypothetical protein
MLGTWKLSRFIFSFERDRGDIGVERACYRNESRQVRVFMGNERDQEKENVVKPQRCCPDTDRMLTFALQSLFTEKTIPPHDRIHRSHSLNSIAKEMRLCETYRKNRRRRNSGPIFFEVK